MTSKHLFFKAMGEDLRHKTWMIVLSCLGNFLIFPVAWLIFRSNTGYYSSFGISRYNLDFFSRYASITGGMLAVAGALIVGLGGFRYVFHKNMIDTYHSLPLSRRTLYGVCWLNGFLIWLVPFLICYVVAMAMAIPLLMDLSEVFPEGRMMAMAILMDAGKTFVTLAVVFLLVYHLVLTAMMLSGNILNTLVSMVILGFGVISVYALAFVFITFYMDTGYLDHINPVAYYTSPLISALRLLYMRYDNISGLGRELLLNSVVMALLGGAAWGLYSRRSSELAEQGIRNKVLSAALRLLASVVAGMGGWVLFVLFTGSSTTNWSWGVFGALLAGVLVYGVMDIIFSMDFKAFFTHRLQMAASTVITMVVCFCFYGDIFGYDTYLPDKEDIAEIAIIDGYISNRSFSVPSTHMQDIDAAYAYLEKMTERERGAEGSVQTETAIRYARSLITKVTLRNGRSYYRRYTVTNADMDVLWPLVSDPAYLEQNYLVPEEMVAYLDQLSLYRMDTGHSWTSWADVDNETLWDIAQAYNQDLMENPAAVLLGQGSLLTRVKMSTVNEYFMNNRPIDAYINLEVYDTMERTVEALERSGYGEWTRQLAPEEVQEIRLPLNGTAEAYGTIEDVLDAAQVYYDVYIEDTDITEGGSSQNDSREKSGSPVHMSPQAQTVSLAGEILYLSITDSEEIRELLEFVNYTGSYYADNVFLKQGVEIMVMTNNDEEYWYGIKRGELPEKYILRFGELYESLMGE